MFARGGITDLHAGKLVLHVCVCLRINNGLLLLLLQHGCIRGRRGCRRLRAALHGRGGCVRRRGRRACLREQMLLLLLQLELR